MFQSSFRLQPLLYVKTETLSGGVGGGGVHLQEEYRNTCAGGGNVTEPRKNRSQEG
jgi:hypothetical protein